MIHEIEVERLDTELLATFLALYLKRALLHVANLSCHLRQLHSPCAAMVAGIRRQSAWSVGDMHQTRRHKMVIAGTSRRLYSEPDTGASTPSVGSCA